MGPGCSVIFVAKKGEKLHLMSVLIDVSSTEILPIRKGPGGVDVGNSGVGSALTPNHACT